MILVSACLGVISSASCYRWMTPIFNRLQGPNSEISMTPEEAPWVVSVLDLGTLLSTLPARILINYIGRKTVILISGPLYMVSWLFVIYYPSVYVFVVARLLQGFAIGLVSTAAPVYLGEIANNSSRGAVTSMFFNSWWLGYILIFTLGATLSFYTYAYVTLALNIPFLVFFNWQPESPHFFMMIGEKEKAREALRWFRDGSDEELDEELCEMENYANSNVKSSSVQDVIATPGGKRAFTLFLASSYGT